MTAENGQQSRPFNGGSGTTLRSQDSEGQGWTRLTQALELLSETLEASHEKCHSLENRCQVEIEKSASLEVQLAEIRSQKTEESHIWTREKETLDLRLEEAQGRTLDLEKQVARLSDQNDKEQDRYEKDQETLEESFNRQQDLLKQERRVLEEQLAQQKQQRREEQEKFEENRHFWKEERDSFYTDKQAYLHQQQKWEERLSTLQTQLKQAQGQVALAYRTIEPQHALSQSLEKGAQKEEAQNSDKIAQNYEDIQNSVFQGVKSTLGEKSYDQEVTPDLQDLRALEQRSDVSEPQETTSPQETFFQEIQVKETEKAKDKPFSSFDTGLPDPDTELSEAEKLAQELRQLSLLLGEKETKD